MSTTELKVVQSVFEPTPIQLAFLKSDAKVRGYGGAMGGGKSRAICEAGLDYALDYPRLRTLIARQRHTSIIETTKKTMMEEVLPPEMYAVEHGGRKKESGGEDYVQLFNGSRFHFVGLEDPERWFSSEIGLLIVDQVEECAEDTIIKLITRLRQRNAPLKVILSFNPDNPGHWLQRWFMLGASRTDHGFVKSELWATGALRPIGDCEFFFAKATDNPYLPAGYVDETLAGLPEHLRRRYRDGLWEFISGTCYFDQDALGAYQEEIAGLGRPRWVGYTEGDLGPSPKRKIRIRAGKEGPWHVWKPPVRERRDPDGTVHDAHRYVAAVDVSSGGSTDYSAIQVIDVEAFEQVAEYQGKADPDLVAVEAYRIGRIYNDALVAPEITGGYGATIVRELERLGYKRLFTRRTLDRISKQWTDRLGWDTTSASKAHMLDTLERVLRERELKLYSERTLAELGSFVRSKTPGGKDTAGAQPGTNDDLVVALAIAVTLVLDRPRQLRKPVRKPHRPQFAATGY